MRKAAELAEGCREWSKKEVYIMLRYVKRNEGSSWRPPCRFCKGDDIKPCSHNAALCDVPNEATFFFTERPELKADEVACSGWVGARVKAHSLPYYTARCVNERDKRKGL